MTRTLIPRLLLATCAAALCLPGAAKDFPPITPEQRELTSVDYHANAPAVILEDWGYYNSDGRGPATLERRVRIKILTEEGQEYGEYAITHTRRNRLRGLEARTVLADGTVIEVDKDVIFTRRTSRSARLYETVITFPRAEPGAILDYRYRTGEHPYIAPEWVFQSWLPVAHSEITYEVPFTWTLQPWTRSPGGRRQVETDFRQSNRRTYYSVWMDGLPGLPAEPYAPPRFDRVNLFKFMLMKDEKSGQTLFASWKDSCKLWDRFSYAPARRKAKQAKKRAKAIAAEHPTELAQAQAIYAFVRDSIRTENLSGTTIADGSSPDSVLSEGLGDYAEKGLLLQQMLSAIGLDARLVWARDRYRGLGSNQVFDPNWFDTVLVRVTVGEQLVDLDPSDPDIAFGRLPYAYEGTLAVVFDTEEPELIELPVSDAMANQRRALVELAVDAEGRVTGTGTMTLTGHQAWRKIDGTRNAPETLEMWSERLTDAYPGFAVSDVSYEESVADQQVDVSWSVTQLEEELLGDEVSLKLSRPLGPIEQPFDLDPSARTAPVLFRFARHDELEVTVRWPEDWSVDIRPDNQTMNANFGEVAVDVTVDESERRLTYKRRFDVRRREFDADRGYTAIVQLYDHVGRSDAQELVLIAD